jgi:hypothetical protein
MYMYIHIYIYYIYIIYIYIDRQIDRPFIFFTFPLLKSTASTSRSSVNFSSQRMALCEVRSQGTQHWACCSPVSTHQKKNAKSPFS